jgi:hypothetical protein
MTTTPPHRLPLPGSWHRLGPRRASARCRHGVGRPRGDGGRQRRADRSDESIGVQKRPASCSCGSHRAIAKPVRYLGVTDHDDFGREPVSPPPDQQPASGAEDTPPHAWSGPPLEQHRREGEQDARSAGYGYGEQSGMLGEPAHAEMRQQGQQAPPREPSTTGPRQGVHWSSGVGGSDSVTATPPTGWNYVDSIAARELLPTRKVPPARGWSIGRTPPADTLS